MATKTKYPVLDSGDIKGTPGMMILQLGDELIETDGVNAQEAIAQGWQPIDYVTLSTHVGLDVKSSYTHFYVMHKFHGDNVIVENAKVPEYIQKGYAFGKSGSSGARGKL